MAKSTLLPNITRSRRALIEFTKSSGADLGAPRHGASCCICQFDGTPVRAVSQSTRKGFGASCQSRRYRMHPRPLRRGQAAIRWQGSGGGAAKNRGQNVRDWVQKCHGLGIIFVALHQRTGQNGQINASAEHHAVKQRSFRRYLNATWGARAVVRDDRAGGVWVRAQMWHGAGYQRNNAQSDLSGLETGKVPKHPVGQWPGPGQRELNTSWKWAHSWQRQGMVPSSVCCAGLNVDQPAPWAMRCLQPADLNKSRFFFGDRVIRERSKKPRKADARAMKDPGLPRVVNALGLGTVDQTGRRGNRRCQAVLSGLSSTRCAVQSTALCKRIVNRASMIKAANIRSVLARPLANSIR